MGDRSLDTAWTRRLWRLFEPYHAVTYFAPESRERYRDAGLRGGWMGYFAGRSAPMGSVGAPVVASVFYNFHPAMVRRAIPDAWAFSSPERVLAARLDAVDAALRRLLGEDATGPPVREAAALARAAVHETRPEGRPLFAANAALPEPDEPHLALWWATTCLREHRGDGHVTALVHAGIDGCEAHVALAALGRSGGVGRDVLQPNRGWTDDEWAAASERLAARGWLRDGEATDAGRAGRQALEDDTDRLALEPWARLGEERTNRFATALEPLTRRLLAAGAIPATNPIGPLLT